MKKACLAAAAVTILALGGIHAEAQAGPPPGWIHIDAKAGCVFGNAPHHWFKPIRGRALLVSALGSRYLQGGRRGKIRTIF